MKYLRFRVIPVFRGPNGAFLGVAKAGRGMEQARLKPPRSQPAIFIRSVDVIGSQIRGPEQAAGYISECGEPFYGTMVGPWWYHTATSVPRVRNPPFSLLRMLMQPSRKPPRGEGRRPNAECRTGSVPGHSSAFPPFQWEGMAVVSGASS